MTEADLARSFQRKLPFVYGPGKPPVSSQWLAEMDAPFRRPDFAQLDWLEPVSNDLVARLTCFSSLVTARVYLAMRGRDEASWRDLQHPVGFEPSTIRSKLHELHRAGWLDRRGRGRYSPASERTVPEFRLHTYELKLTDWRRAAEQMMAHSLYADRSILVMVRPQKAETRDRVESFLRGPGLVPHPDGW